MFAPGGRRIPVTLAFLHAWNAALPATTVPLEDDHDPFRESFSMRRLCRFRPFSSIHIALTLLDGVVTRHLRIGDIAG